jgi:hypothetical protein
VPRREQLDELVLHAVRVLVLVDQHVLPTTLVEAQDLREALEELNRLEQQVAEVERVRIR